MNKNRPQAAEALEDLLLLNQIAQTLNQAVDVQSAFSRALAQLVQLMGLEVGWVFALEPDNRERWHGRGFRLIAHHNLPPGMALDNPEAWDGGCNCRRCATLTR
ncbi:MAG: hypothetical protein HC915_12305 [Anaerolineae bacterium]|nr:hypothetical protein [Anaerolineae bacterium]